MGETRTPAGGLTRPRRGERATPVRLATGGSRPVATVRLGCNHGIHGMHGRDLGEGGFFTLRHGDTEIVRFLRVLRGSV